MELTEKQKKSARNILLRALNVYEEHLNEEWQDGEEDNDQPDDLKKLKYARQYLKDLKEHGE